MVAMQVRDKNMADFTAPYLIFWKLHLSSFSAINQKKPVIQRNDLRRWMPVVGRQRRIISKYRYTKHAIDLKNWFAIYN